MAKFDFCALSSRVRLARNLVEYPFAGPRAADNGVIIDRVVHTLKPLGDFTLIRMSELDAVTAEHLKDRYIISPLLCKNERTGAVVKTDDDSLSIMINEEDHLRMQFFSPGFSLDEAYDNLRYISRKLSERMEFATDSQFGYITACMSNLGTGMRASVMLFLPALKRSGRIKSIISEMKALGLTVRGANGEGSNPVGCMYQVSNEVTLGYSEQEIVRMVSFAVRKLCELEYGERDKAIIMDPVAVEDECCRAYGILTNCRKLSYDEFAELFVSVALGAYYKFFDMSFSDLGRLFSGMRPAVLAHETGALSAAEGEIVRARIVREVLWERNSKEH